MKPVSDNIIPAPKTWSCIRCGHSWYPHHWHDNFIYGLKPKACPKCKSTNWDLSITARDSGHHCWGICSRFLEQIKKLNRYNTKYNRRVIKKISKLSSKEEYYYCHKCEIYIKPHMAFFGQRIQCPCCGSMVRLNPRYSQSKREKKYV